MRMLCALALAALTCVALAQPENRELRRSMERFYEKWDNVIESGSMSGLRNMVEPDFYQVDQQGKRVTFDGFEDMMSGAMRRRDATSSTTVLHVRESSNEAIVWLKNVMTWSEAGEGKLVKTRFISHTLRRTPAGWKVYYSQILPDNESWGPPPGK